MSTSIYSHDSGVFGSARVQLIWAGLDGEALLQAIGQRRLAPGCRLGLDLLSVCSGMEVEGAALTPGMFFSRQIPGVQRGKPRHATLASHLLNSHEPRQVTGPSPTLMGRKVHPAAMRPWQSFECVILLQGVKS